MIHHDYPSTGVRINVTIKESTRTGRHSALLGLLGAPADACTCKSCQSIHIDSNTKGEVFDALVGS